MNSSTRLHVRSLDLHCGTPGVDCDVHITLNDGSEYVTTFCTIDHILKYFAEESTSLPYPHSEFLPDPYIVIVRRLDQSVFRDILEMLLRNGTFMSFCVRAKSEP